jgi:hypothetical protein
MYFTRSFAVETISTVTMRCRDGGNSEMFAAIASISFLKSKPFHLLDTDVTVSQVNALVGDCRRLWP